MYELIATNQFKKDLKRIKKRKQSDLTLIETVLSKLKSKGVEGISNSMYPHKLQGNYKDNWECHIKPDLLIIWIQIEKPKTVRLVRIGTHSDLF